MKKRMTITIISVVSALLLLCGLTAFAASSPGTPASDSLTGVFKSLSADGGQMTLTTDKGDQSLTLAKSVWVYRNGQKAQLSDLKPGDRIEAIMNSKNQAAYLKAATVQPAAPAPQPSGQTAPPQPKPPAPPAPTAPQTNPPAASVPPANAGAAGASPQTILDDPSLKDLELDIDGQHFKLRIEPNHGTGGTRYELNLKPDRGAPVHLKGDEAASWIKDLLGSVDLKSANVQQQLLQAIADRFGIDAGKLHIRMNAENSIKASAAAKQHDEADDDDGDDVHDDEHDGGKSSDHGKKTIQKSDNNKHGKEHDKKERD